MQIDPNLVLPLKKIGPLTDKAGESELKKACRDFEAIILQQMLTTMRKSVPKDGLLASSYSQEMYQGIYDEELAKEMAHGRGIGIADALYRQLAAFEPQHVNKKV